MRVAICDDEPAFVQVVKEMITECGFYHESWQVSTLGSGEELLFLYEQQRHPFDIVLLDIRMAGIDGLAAGMSIRTKDSGAVIIYLTSYGQFSLAAYDSFPLYYMVKPVSQKRFLTVFTKACALVKKRREEAVCIHSREVDRILPIHEICYLESYQHNIIVHTVKGEAIQCTGSLRAMLSQIDKPYFFRTHRSFVVNLYETASFSSGKRRIFLKDGAELPVSRQRVREFAKKFVEVHTHVEHL